MADIRYAKPGDKPIRSASTFNAMIDAARANQRTDNTDPNVVRVTRDPSVLQVVNNSQGATGLPRFAIVGIDDPVFVPIDNLGAEQTLIEQTCLSITWPATDSYRGRFAVLLEPLAIDGVGTARLCDTQIVFTEQGVTVGDSVDIDEASRPDANVLSSVAGGVAQVLWSGPARDGAYHFSAVADGGSPTGFSWVLEATECYITPTAAELTADIGEPATINDTHSGTSSVAPPLSQWGLIRFGGAGAGGGTTEIVKFSILSACPGLTGDSSADSCNCVQGVITRVVCGSSLNVGDFITVWDIDTCWFNVPLDLLLSRSGTAILMENNVLDGSAPNCTGYGDLRPEACFWNVESLCCSEEVYASA